MCLYLWIYVSKSIECISRSMSNEYSRVYKGWYYGFYINTPRNITIDSCTTIDSQVGIFTFVIGPSRMNFLFLSEIHL